uniref:Cytochrome c oxidase subunit 3 n=1 Tax=Emeia pseudosauteri TaxID=2592744 RepID=A0A5C0PWY0_9COLE|nr:cytochrome c oxidase subunit 3 [Emeia pseudosauteri]QEJ81583.1 cytochrome c oxidase subunit 3 [Emeia pseudosauteri]
MTNKNHTYHLVEISPWPIVGSLSTLTMMIGLIKWFHMYNHNLILIGSMSTLMVMYQWWRDISRESSFQGLHTLKVTKGLRWGMILFITSEILFFVSFFWSFYHSSLSPTIEIGMTWPPNSIIPFNPIQIPLLNTLILISSGISVTWAHHSLMENNYIQTIQGLLITIILGLYFTILQGYEYFESSFSMADSVFGSTFFLATGFHGLHVIIGTLFLLVCLLRHLNNYLSSFHHFGFEAAAWYWHFVDVVWLFLYISIYWWGS